MKIFMMKSLALAALMFIAVLAGMQIADDGMNKMRGQHGQTAVSINEMNAEGKASDPLGHDLQAKQQKLEYINGINLFSEMGRKVAEGVTDASQSILSSLAGE